MKKQTIKNILFTLAFPVVMYIIMDIIVLLSKGTHIISSMLDFKSIVRNAGIAATIAYALGVKIPEGWRGVPMAKMFK